MTFGISVDAAAWRLHCDDFRDRVYAADAALIPVIKGHGYGLGQELLAREAMRMGVRAISVGTIHEVASVADTFSGDIVVLEPVDPRDDVAVAAWRAQIDAGLGERLIRTVACTEGLDFVIDTHPQPRVIIEGRTSMRRFGFAGPTLREGWGWATQAAEEGRLRLLGLTLHLPISPSNADFDEILQLVDEIGDDSAHVLLSHVDARGIEILRRHKPTLRVSLRVGTGLWLGLRGALHAHGSVLAVHRVAKGDTLGYQRRKALRDGYVVVVSGGTAHGVGLTAPSPVVTARQRVVSFGVGLLEALGRAKSPFSYNGRDLWFVDTPHQHVSMLWLPASATPPAVGTALPADVRYTITRGDSVLLR